MIVDLKFANNVFVFSPRISGLQRLLDVTDNTGFYLLIPGCIFLYSWGSERGVHVP